MKKAIIAVFRVFATNIRFVFGKIVHGSRFKYSPVTALALSDSVTISRGATVCFGSRLRTRGRCVFNSQENGVLTFGNGVFLNTGCQLNCHNKISIGDGCEFGPNVLIYDHDHNFRNEKGIKSKTFLYDSVEIGNECWIGAGTIILRGTKLGDNCVVGAGCVLKGEYPDNSRIIQTRNTSVKVIEGDSDGR